MARVTVINDNPDFLGVMDEVLQHLGHVGTVLPGESVTVEQIADTRPELLIVDLRMASQALNDGWGVVVGARAHPDLKDVPVVLCTADHDLLRDRSKEISALADVHPLPKPFGIDDVEEVMRQLLDRDPAEDPGGRKEWPAASPEGESSTLPVG